VEVSERDSGIRLAELVAVFSLAMDLGLGQPMEHVLRSWLIAARLGDHLGVGREQRGSLFYVVTLAWVGCVADTPEVATFGDDIAYRGGRRGRRRRQDRRVRLRFGRRERWLRSWSWLISTSSAERCGTSTER
jgi:hypothetical protein